jgi:prepilin-type processing-associated H-X9-DG protein
MEADMKHKLDANRVALRSFVCVAIVVLGIFVIGYATRVRAQNETKVYATPDETAKAFIALISSDERPIYDYAYRGYHGYSVTNRELFSALISTDSAKRLQSDGVDEVLRRMIYLAHQPTWETDAETSSDGNSATVKVKPVSSVTQEVVCMREGEGWRVDLVATYAKWFKLDEQQLDHFINDEREVRRRVSCQNNMKQIALGIMQYIQDYDEKFPPAKQWKDAVMPYVKSEQIFHCPSVDENKDGYALNWKLSTKNVGSSLMYSPSMVMLYESTALKPNHSGEGQDMAFRHMGGTNIGFVDGHIRWYKENPERKWPEVHFTFQPGDVVKPRR